MGDASSGALTGGEVAPEALCVLLLSLWHQARCLAAPAQGSSAELSALLGFGVAAVIMVPAVLAGPSLSMPPALGLVFYELALFAGQGWLPCLVSATAGVPLACPSHVSWAQKTLRHALLLVPSITFQYALPAVIAPAAGLLAARLLGGLWSQQLCLVLMGILWLLHGRLE